MEEYLLCVNSLISKELKSSLPITENEFQGLLNLLTLQTPIIKLDLGRIEVPVRIANGAPPLNIWLTQEWIEIRGMNKLIAWIGADGIMEALKLSAKSSIIQIGGSNCHDILQDLSFFGKEVNFIASSSSSYDIFHKNDLVGKASCSNGIPEFTLNRQYWHKELLSAVNSELARLGNILDGYLSIESQFDLKSLRMELFTEISAFGIKKSSIGEITWFYGDSKPKFEGVDVSLDAIFERVISGYIKSVKGSLPEEWILEGLGSFTINREASNFILDLRNQSISAELDGVLKIEILETLGIPNVGAKLTFNSAEGFLIPHLSSTGTLDITEHMNKMSRSALSDFGNLTFSKADLHLDPFQIEAVFSADIAGLFKIPSIECIIDRSGIHVSFAPSIPLPPLPLGTGFYLLDGIITIDTDEKIVTGDGLITLGATASDARSFSKVAHLISNLNVSYSRLGDLSFKAELVLVDKLSVLSGNGELQLSKATANIEISSKGVLKAIMLLNGSLFVDAKNRSFKSATEINLLGITGSSQRLNASRSGDGISLRSELDAKILIGKAKVNFGTVLDPSGLKSIIRNTNAGLKCEVSDIDVEANVTYHRVQARLKAFGISLGVEVPHLDMLDPTIIENMLLSIFDFEVSLDDILNPSMNLKFKFGGGDGIEGKDGRSGGSGSSSKTSPGEVSVKLNTQYASESKKSILSELERTKVMQDVDNISISKSSSNFEAGCCYKEEYEDRYFDLKWLSRTKTRSKLNKMCPIFNIENIKTSFSNHPNGLTDYEYVYDMNTLRPCTSCVVQSADKACSNTSPTVFGMVVKNQLLDTYIGEQQFLPILTAIPNQSMQFGSGIMTFIEPEIWTSLPSAMKDKVSMEIPRDYVYTNDHLKDQVRFRGNLMLQDKKMYLFLTYDLLKKVSEKRPDSFYDLFAEFTGKVLYPVEMSKFRVLMDEYESAFVSAPSAYNLIRDSLENKDFKETLDLAIISYVTSLGQYVTTESELKYAHSSPELYYAGAFKDLSNGSFIDRFKFEHYFENDDTNHELMIDKNGSIVLEDDEVINELIPGGVNKPIERVKREQYALMLEANEKILSKYVLFKGLLTIPDTQDEHQNYNLTKYGGINYYQLVNANSSTIVFLKKDTVSRTSGHLFKSIILNNSDLDLERNPKIIETNKVWMSNMAYWSVYAKDKIKSFSQKSQSFNETSPHKDFFNRFIRTGIQPFTSTYIDAYEDDGKYYLSAIFESRDTWEIIWENKDFSINTELLTRSGNTLRENFDSFQSRPLILDSLKINQIQHTGIRFKRTYDNEFHRMMRILKGLRRDKTWVRSSTYESTVNPLSVFFITE
ncbi:MAG: hypothetical protein AAF789_01055 [Bacteroidota bacterium]